jgi:hypothetical protein
MAQYCANSWSPVNSIMIILGMCIHNDVIYEGAAIPSKYVEEEVKSTYW